MKRLLIMLVVLLSMKATKAQYVMDNEPWCPPGATWVYKMFCPTCQAYVSFSYEKDTTINNVLAKKINATQIIVGSIGPGVRQVNPLSPEFMYVSGDSLYIFDSPQFIFVNKFNLNIGDLLILNNTRSTCSNTPNYPQKDTITVTGIKLDTVGNRIYKRYLTTHKWLVNPEILNNIGSRSCFVPEIDRLNCASSSSDYFGVSFFEGLLCYSDNVRGDLLFGYTSAECHGIKTDISVIKQDNHNKFSIYPNPTSRTINIVSQQKDLEINKFEIYDIVGNRVMQIENKLDEIDVSYLSNGTYILNVISNKGTRDYLKFIKQ